MIYKSNKQRLSAITELNFFVFTIYNRLYENEISRKDRKD